LLASDVQLSNEDLEQLDKVTALSPEYPGWMISWPWDERI
jgi:hypothetical protein